MAKEIASLKFKMTLATTPDEVYSAFTHASALCEWLCNVAQTDTHEGGRIYLWWENGYYASGEYITLKPNQQITFSWHGRNEPGKTHIKISLTSENNTTRLTLIHAGIGNGKAWNKPIREYKKGWKRALENLKSVLETGQDLRLIRQPVLGIKLGEVLTEKQAIELNLPTRYGILIEEVMEGLGAQSAGLQKNDLLVKIKKHKIRNFEDYRLALRGLSAGDTVKITIYRNGKKLVSKVTLSERLIPPLPQTVEALLQKLEDHYRQTNSRLQAALANLPEAIVSFRPALGSWCVKEILAHLVLSERDMLTWISNQIDGGDPVPLTLHPATPTRVSAILAAFADVPALLRESKRHQTEALAMIQGLPEEFVARKRSFWRLSYALMTYLPHLEKYVTQIETTVTKVKPLFAERVHDITIGSLEPEAHLGFGRK